MPTWVIWEEPNCRPEGPVSERLRTPWLVTSNSNCPVCRGGIAGTGGVIHSCGERLFISDTTDELVLLVKYPVGYSLIRTESWDRFLIESREFQLQSRLPISVIHAAAWVIWNGEGNAPAHWTTADHCPECSRKYSGRHQVTFRCECSARLLPVSVKTLESVQVADIVSKLWEEQAFYLKINGVHVLFSTANMPPRP